MSIAAAFEQGIPRAAQPDRSLTGATVAVRGRLRSRVRDRALSLLTSAAFGMVAAFVVFEQSGRSKSYKAELRFMFFKIALSVIAFLSVMFYLKSGFSDFHAELAPRFETLTIPVARIKVYLAPLASVLAVILLCLLRWAVSHRKKAGGNYQGDACQN